MARIRAYFKLDLYFFEHPKVVDLSHAAMVLYIASIAYANRRETDGYIARPVLRRLIEVDEQEGRGAQDVAKELVQARLWLEAEGGWEVHDFLDHNESSDERDDRRAGERDRKRRARAQAKGPSGDVPPDKGGRPSGQKRPSEPVHGIAVAVTEQSTTEGNTVVAFRADIDALCDLLADGIHANTGERPKIGKRWHDACRLLLDQDGYTAEQVETLIRWSQADEFWRSNILSMPKLREKRLNLIGQMQRGNHSKPTSRLLAEDAKLARWADTLEGGEHAAERMAPHRGQARRELPRPSPPG